MKIWGSMCDPGGLQWSQVNVRLIFRESHEKKPPQLQTGEPLSQVKLERDTAQLEVRGTNTERDTHSLP